MKDSIRDLESSKGQWKEILSRFWIASFVNQATKRESFPLSVIHVARSLCSQSVRRGFAELINESASLLSLGIS